MAKGEKDILTTAQTAKLLGVSTRTAQLLIESGTVPSWKTPGGHRRVYRADVMAIIASDNAATAAHASAIVVVIGSQDRLPMYDRLFASRPEFLLRPFEDVLQALVAVGSLKPHAIIVDAWQGGPDRTALTRSLATNKSTSDSDIIVVGALSERLDEISGRYVQVDTPEQAVAAILSSLDGGDGTSDLDIEAGIPLRSTRAGDWPHWIGLDC